VRKGSDARTADHPIDALFLDRWSPRAMTGEPLALEELLLLFEAARWAPSSGNSQPWRFLFARRDTAEWPLFFDLLNDGNKVWCERAAALIVFVSRTTLERTGKPSVTHSYSTGAAWMSLAFQGWMKGLVVHGMEGFDYARARSTLQVPDEFSVEAMAAVGRPGPLDVLPERLQQRESPSPRRALAESVFEGRFGATPSALL
jgi:nitroreductase